MSSPRKSPYAEGPGADVVLHGTVAPGFEEVREELRRNFTERNELGASCAVYLRGQKVVDLWGGWKDASTREPWQEDTCALVFSTTKGMAAITAAVAHSRGWLDYDAPVAAYWPEFAQAGKARVTVRQLLAHQAGLPALDENLDTVKLADLDYLARVLARQAPAWEPGTRHGYHSFTIGWYLGELIRRVDPQHRSLGRFFQEEVAAPLGIHFHIGLPQDVPASRVARLQAVPSLHVLFHEHSLPTSMMLAFLWPRSLTARALGNPRSRRLSDFDTPEYPPARDARPAFQQAEGGYSHLQGTKPLSLNVERCFSKDRRVGGSTAAGRTTRRTASRPPCRSGTGWRHPHPCRSSGDHTRRPG